MTHAKFRVRRWLWSSALALSGLAAAMVWYLGLLDAAEREPTHAQLAGLERRVQALQERAQRELPLRAALNPAGETDWLPNYMIECAAPWRELGAIGQGLWGCQAPEPQPSGFYPNCNLTSAPVKPGLSAQAYYEAHSAAGQPLSAAGQLGGRTLRLGRRTAYEGSFEHRLTGIPLRVLATIVIEDARVFAITCSAPPAVFETFAPRFREIASSFDLGA
jgi:hypothetical protein